MRKGDKAGESLVDAAMTGELREVEKALAGAAAAKRGHTKVVRALLAAGGDPNKGEREPGEPVEPSVHEAMNPLDLLVRAGAPAEAT